MLKRRLFLVVFLLFLLSGCASVATPLPTPTDQPVAQKCDPTRDPSCAKPTTAPTGTSGATAVPTRTKSLKPTIPQPTMPHPTLKPHPTATTYLKPVGTSTFVIPTVVPTPTPGVITISQNDDINVEVKQVFALFYQARTLTPGGDFDLATVEALTSSPYSDYTVPLLLKDQNDAQAGKLLSISYKDINVSAEGMDGGGIITVNLTRTIEETRDTGTLAPQTATLKFRLHYTNDDKHKNTLTIFDFYNPTLNKWLSDPTTVSTEQASTEVAKFFNQFYQARTLTPGGNFDLTATTQLTRYSYYQYTVPLLQEQQDEVTQGKLTSVTYTDIQTEVTNWDPQASQSGGLATVKVTRTSNVVRPTGAEPAQTGTYQFKLLRNIDESGSGLWVAVDFLSPISGKWVSESAGMSGPVPPAGHG